MAYLDEKKLTKHIASKKYNNIYVLFGDEKFLIKHYGGLLLNKIAGEVRDEFAFHEFTKEVDLQALNVAVNTIAFTATCNCVVVYDMDVNGLDQGDYSALKKIVENVPDTTVVIFSYPTFDIKLKKDKKNEDTKFKKFCDFVVDGIGEVYELSHRDAVALEHQLAAWADKRGKKLSLPTASKIIYSCGTELATLKNEMDKLIAFIGDREEITVEDVEKVTTKKLEAKIFDLVDYVILGNTEKACGFIHKLFELNEEPRNIVRILGEAYVDIYRAKVTVESGGNLKDTADFFKYRQRAWLLTKYKSKSERLSMNAVRRSMAEILDLNARFNTVMVNEKAEVEKLIVRLILIAKSEIDYA